MKLIVASDTNFQSLALSSKDVEGTSITEIEIVSPALFPYFLMGDLNSYFNEVELNSNEQTILLISASYSSLAKFKFEPNEIPVFAKLPILEDLFDLIFINEFSSVGELHNFLSISYFSPQTLGSRIMSLNYFLISLTHDLSKSFLLPIILAHPINDKRRQKLIKTSKSLFFPDEMASMLNNIELGIQAIFRQPFKVIALDLDNTLWGGVIGEDGIDKIRLGGHDHVGEYYSHFQMCLKRLKEQGFLLVILSKNNEELALDVISNHPDMILQIEDFADHQINWQEKHENIKKISQNLSLNLDSFIFIDDNPIERIKMSTHLPEVTVLPFPQQIFELHEELNKEAGLSKSIHTQEDSVRTLMYQQEKKRKKFLASSEGTNTESLAEKIGMVISKEIIVDKNKDRACQLVNRTNQFTLSGKKYSEDEFEKLRNETDVFGFVVRAKDNFGDYGIVSTVIYREDKTTLNVLEFSMSCRILGRNIEDQIFTELQETAENCKKSLNFSFMDTGKNKVIKLFLEKKSALN